MWRKWADVAFWLGLSIYFGGLLTVGAIVAPALFSKAIASHVSMPGITSPPLDMERQVGGELFGEILNRFGIVEAACLGLMLVGIAGWILGHRHVRRSTFIILVLWTMVALLAGLDAAWIRPKVWTLRGDIRKQAPAHIADAPATPLATAWPDKAEFDRLHTWDEALGRAKVYTLLAMLFVTAWRGLADKRGFAADKGDVMRKTFSKPS